MPGQPNPIWGGGPIPIIDLYNQLRGATTPTDPGGRAGTAPLAPGSPGGAQTPMQLPPNVGANINYSMGRVPLPQPAPPHPDLPSNETMPPPSLPQAPPTQFPPSPSPPPPSPSPPPSPPPLPTPPPPSPSGDLLPLAGPEADLPNYGFDVPNESDVAFGGLPRPPFTQMPPGGPARERRIPPTEIPNVAGGTRDFPQRFPTGPGASNTPTIQRSPPTLPNLTQQAGPQR